MENEQWRRVEYPGDWYEVSSLGRMRSYHQRGSNKSGRLSVPAPMRTSLDAHGYPVVALHDRGRCKHSKVHRLVLAAFVGPCPPGMEGSHLDGDPSNAALANLTYETHGDNLRRRGAHGTGNEGARNGQAKLTEEGVAAARRMYRVGVHSFAVVAARFGVEVATIRDAILGVSWRSVAEPPCRSRTNGGNQRPACG
jgi:hypothetical protein